MKNMNVEELESILQCLTHHKGNAYWTIGNPESQSIGSEPIDANDEAIISFRRKMLDARPGAQESIIISDIEWKSGGNVEGDELHPVEATFYRMVKGAFIRVKSYDKIQYEIKKNWYWFDL